MPFPISTFEGLVYCLAATATASFQGLAAMKWSESDNYFVNGSLKVYSVVDLSSSEPLKLVSEENIIYDGPKRDDFKTLLLDNGFRVNRQGKAIVRIPKRHDEEEYNFFLLQIVLPLGPYGFENVESSPTQEVEVLKSLLEGTRADLAKKNAEVDELQRQILNWKLTLDAMTESMKKVFINIDVDDPKPTSPSLPPPPPQPTAPARTSGGYSLISVVTRFLNKLRCDLFLEKEEELGATATFLVAANEILSSIAAIFYQRTGLKIGMETSTTTTITPADLIQNLNSLREFVERRFLIDGSVIVKAFGLMNEKDIPVIFRDSERDVAELHRKEAAAKSIANIDGKSIFYGYYNIPGVGKFKGVLTRIDVTLPDEIMVKLKNYNELDENKFWFVKANGEAIFTLKNESLSTAIVDSSWVFLEFLLRINRTFVNKKGNYLKFEFTAIKYPESRYKKSGLLNYYDKDYFINSPFSRVQFDRNESPAAFVVQGQVSLPVELSYTDKHDFFESVLKDHLGEVCAFEVEGFCFIGNVREDKDACFRNNALVEEFFKEGQFGESCYVDALATTFFISNPLRTLLNSNNNKVVPKFVI